MMLECAIGGFEHFGQSEFLHDALQWAFTEEGQVSI